MKLRVGDKVLVKRPEDKSEGPGWEGSMDYMDGKTATIAKFEDDGDVLLEEDPVGYSYDPKWLTKVDSKKTEDKKVRDSENIRFIKEWIEWVENGAKGDSPSCSEFRCSECPAGDVCSILDEERHNALRRFGMMELALEKSLVALKEALEEEEGKEEENEYSEAIDESVKHWESNLSYLRSAQEHMNAVGTGAPHCALCAAVQSVCSECPLGKALGPCNEHDTGNPWRAASLAVHDTKRRIERAIECSESMVEALKNLKK